MKTPIVFSLVHEQSLFMTVIMGLLTFLSVLALGIALSIGTGVMRWNAQWNLYATVQIMNTDNTETIKKILTENRDKIETLHEVSTDEMKKMLTPWISGGNALENYLPKMYEVQFKTQDDLNAVKSQVKQNARFLTHAESLHATTSAGWKMIFIAALVLALTLCAIGICITFIARNTALLHRRELEILNQIGANDSFIAHQMQRIVAKICFLACGIGFVVALPILGLILSAAASARVGLMAMLGLNAFGWTLLFLMPILIIVFAISITKRTTIKILENS